VSSSDGPDPSGETADIPELVWRALERSRALGLLGPGPVADHVEHATAMAACVPVPRRFVDLGSGGGVPGLVLATVWPTSEAVLLDSAHRRIAVLVEAIESTGLGDRVTVAEGRAEAVARDPRHRGHSDLVVARSFGPPAATAECAAGFLEPGGRLLVSEPPEDDPTRWPAEGLARLGFGPAEVQVAGGRRYSVMVLVRPVPDQYPRRIGVPEKRPLWNTAR
jgi:16S rRNA (guanine527-N7)-methyltransferase